MQLAFESFLTPDPASLLPPVVGCVNLFAGGGGTSLGYTSATGREPDLAINHDLHAIRLHKLNHPHTLHLREDVRARTPRSIVQGRPVRLVAASPDCTHFSRAKGKKPRENHRRGLAWVVVDWAREARPDIIIVENVAEFAQWGPLDEAGQPIKALKGTIFCEWRQKLEDLGYQTDWRLLNAADFGAPTARVRLFFVARRDGVPIVWPSPTHGPGLLNPWRTAAECIDWSIPVPSIFNRRRPLAEATERRIALGLKKYVIDRPPFVVPSSDTGFILQTSHQSSHAGKVRSLQAPVSTIVTKAEHCLVVAHLAQHQGQSIGRGVDAPAPSITTTGQGHLGLVCAWMAKHYGNGVIGHGLQQPLGTITTVDHHSLCTASLSPLAESGAERVAAFLIKYYGNGGQWQTPSEPLDTVVTKARFGLVTVHIKGEPYVITDIGMRMLQPRELARAMGFPESYVLEGSKEDQIARIGNAVCPPVAQALISALLGEASP